MLLLLPLGPAAAFDHAAVNKRALERHILPGYERFSGAAKDFAKKAAALCQAPSAAALTQARDAARGALLAWGLIEHIRFGPITEQQRFERLLFYPDAHNIVEKQVARLLRRHDEKDLAPEKLAGASVAVQGFTAVDRALYGNGSEALAAPSGSSAFRCRYVRALANGIDEIAQATLAAWTGGFAQTWLHPGSGNATFLAAAETTQALVRSYVTELQMVRLQRLAPELGEELKGHNRPEPIFPHSALAVPFLLANIEGVRDLLEASGFLDPAVAADEKERSAMSVLASVATDLGFALQAGEKAIGIAPDAFASPEARAALSPMLFSLKNAEETGRGALTGLTGLSLGFNALDGD